MQTIFLFLVRTFVGALSALLIFPSCAPTQVSYSPQSAQQTRAISYLNSHQQQALQQNQLPPQRLRPTQGPNIHARCAIVLDANTGRILFEKNPDQRRAVASTQKLLTALLVYERGSWGRNITVTASDTAVEPSKVGVRAGESYSRRDLVHALLVRSGNDVARTLARDHSGSIPAFADAMNRRARQIGMHSSQFVNPHGLTETGQYSTARDIATLALRVWHTPSLRSMVADRRMTLRSSAGRSIPLKTTNRLAEHWDACVGMKTGYTRAAGKCLVSAARINGRNVICVLLGSNSANIWRDSETLLRYGASQSRR